ncbi:MAG: response regulator [Actinobacteria bacterium]|nr:response regulator [Actinomycetota bacterium]
MNVLVVDDDATIGRVLTVALAAEDEVDDVRVVTSGAAALTGCSGFQPDLIILDYWMPGMDGSEAAPRIREMYPNARIVAFSAALDEKPQWADDFYPKGDLPDLHVLVHLDD